MDNVITAYNPKGFARTAKKIIVDLDPNELDKLEMEIELPIVANVKDLLKALNDLENSKLNVIIGENAVLVGRNVIQ